VNKSEVAKVAETEIPPEDEAAPTPDETDQTGDADWEENEPSPHQGEEGQEPV
jgi:hypothetical protein